jgi:hypothetical protein
MLYIPLEAIEYISIYAGLNTPPNSLYMQSNNYAQTGIAVFLEPHKSGESNFIIGAFNSNFAHEFSEHLGEVHFDISKIVTVR